MVNLDKFSKQLPAAFIELCKLITYEGLKVGIVGGVPRDFILYGHTSFDFDCELRSIELCHDITSLKRKWANLLKNLKKEKYFYKELSFGVVRIFSQGAEEEFECEITMPRAENFTGEKGHSNFIAEHITDESYSDGFLRRDFTVNAIMFEFDGECWELIDPLGGEQALERKELVACGPDFSLDPVRFLRAFRFAITKGLSFSSELESQLDQMDLMGLSSFYIKKESEKTNCPLSMFLQMSKTNQSLFKFQTPISEINLDLLNRYEYDVFSEIKDHIYCAYFLPIDIRMSLLKKMNLSVKGSVEVVPLEKKISLNELSKLSLEDKVFEQAFGIFSILEKKDLTFSALDTLMHWLKIECTADEFEKYKKTKYNLTEEDKKLPRNMYRYQIFQQRVGQV